MPIFTGDSSYLSDLSPKDKPWDSHRAAADQVQGLYRAASNDLYATRIEHCGKLLEFALRSDDQGSVNMKLQAAKFCRVRHCPVCQWRRSMKWKARMFSALPNITAAYPTHRWLFLTLTVKNCAIADLRDTLKSMNDAFKRLTKLERYPANGWVKSVEITRNAETGEAHPHFHCLLLVPASYFSHNYIKHEDWRLLWQRCLRVEYLPMVNVQSIKANNPKLTGELQGINQAICEVLKYSVKESDLVADPTWLSELTIQLHKTRAVSVGGVLREYLREEKDDEDLINIEEDKQEEEEEEAQNLGTLFFGWSGQVKRYRKRERLEVFLVEDPIASTTE